MGQMTDLQSRHLPDGAAPIPIDNGKQVHETQEAEELGSHTDVAEFVNWKRHEP
jgi:hypothetical protein